MIRSFLVVGAAAAALIASPSVAKTFSIVNDFGNPVFQYGTVSAANVFTAFAVSDCSNIGVSGLCYRGSDMFQVEFKRDAGRLLLHPGPNAGQNTFLMFTAPRSGIYTFSTTFTSDGTGDGVSLFSSGTGGLTPIGAINPASPTFSYNGAQFLTAGQQVGLGVERGPADYYGDSTLFAGSISGAVPEPASWALMLGGMGVIGAGMRRRTRINTIYA